MTVSSSLSLSRFSSHYVYIYIYIYNQQTSTQPKITINHSSHINSHHHHHHHLRRPILLELPLLHAKHTPTPRQLRNLLARPDPPLLLARTDIADDPRLGRRLRRERELQGLAELVGFHAGRGGAVHVRADAQVLGLAGEVVGVPPLGEDDVGDADSRCYFVSCLSSFLQDKTR